MVEGLQHALAPPTSRLAHARHAHTVVIRHHAAVAVGHTPSTGFNPARGRHLNAQRPQRLIHACQRRLREVAPGSKHNVAVALHSDDVG